MARIGWGAIQLSMLRDHPLTLLGSTRVADWSLHASYGQRTTMVEYTDMWTNRE